MFSLPPSKLAFCRLPRQREASCGSICHKGFLLNKNSYSFLFPRFAFLNAFWKKQQVSARPESKTENDQLLLYSLQRQLS